MTVEAPNSDLIAPTLQSSRPDILTVVAGFDFWGIGAELLLDGAADLLCSPDTATADLKRLLEGGFTSDFDDTAGTWRMAVVLGVEYESLQSALYQF